MDEEKIVYSNYDYLIRRSKENNTHENIVDSSIERISCYMIKSRKLRLAYFYYLISFGIIYILACFFPRFYMSLICEECSPFDADYCLIKDKEKDGNYSLVKIMRKSFHDKNLLFDNFKFSCEKHELAESKYIGKEFKNKHENMILEYRNNIYTFLESENKFVSLNFELKSLRNKEIHDIYSKGISDIKEYNYLLNKFGLNKISLKRKSYINIFIEQLFQPIMIYQVFSIFIWFYQNYIAFASICLFLIVIILVINSYQNYTNYQIILNHSTGINTTIRRNFRIEDDDLLSLNTSKIYIVPGDIIEITNNEVVPCDAIILSGYCNVNESDLTGESNLVMKTPLIYDDKYFSFTSKKHILFSGTKINKCESSESEGKIIALAINTGYNTFRGNLIQNILFPKDTNFNLYSDIKFFMIGMLVIFLISAIITIVFYVKTLAFNNNCKQNNSSFLNSPQTWGKLELVFGVLEGLTIIFPPTLPISLTFTSFYFHFNLNRRGISCISDLRMTAAGRLNYFILDKTGTLTQDGLELKGFQITKLSNDGNEILSFDNIEEDTKAFNLIHIEFWKKFNSEPNHPFFEDYTSKYINNIIYFVECLATCHTIDKLKGDILGNSVDKIILETLGWILEKSSDPSTIGINKYDTKPKDNHRITEINFNLEKKNVKKNTYKLTIVKRFEFSSNFQSNSVIVRNNLDKTYRFFIKGAPEKIIQICNSKSMPVNFLTQLRQHTQSGYRVLACATKGIPERADYESFDDRTYFEKELTFLGFIIFKNKLKEDTKHIISKLLKSGCQLIMATGDNPFTSISVAQGSGLISGSSEIYFANLENERLTFSPISALFDNIGVDKSSYIQGVKTERKEFRSERRLLDDSSNNNEITKNLKRKNNQSITVLNDPELGKYSINYQIKDEIRQFQNNQDNQIICITGSAFNYFFKKYKQEHEEKLENSKTKKKFHEQEYIFHELAEILKEKCKIYSRMQPDHKVDLVNFIKYEKSNIVGMCGDGANDCGALLSADVGVAISKKSSTNITAHFYSQEDSIECIETIMRNGRACYENSVIIFKFMILYGLVQNTSTLLLYSISLCGLTINQHLFIELLIILIPCLLASKTGAAYKLNKQLIHEGMFNKKFIFSVIGQGLIQITFQIVFFLILKNFRINQCIMIDAPCKDSPTLINSFIFVFSSFQFIGILHTFNSNSKHRKKFYQNKSYIIYLIVMLFFCTCFITINDQVNYEKFTFSLITLDDNSQYVLSNESNRILLFISIALNFIFTGLFEKLVDRL